MQLDLLVQVYLLLPDDVKLEDLIVYDYLSIFQSIVNFAYLLLNFNDLLFSFIDHLVAVLNLIVKVVDEFLLLSLFEVVREVLAAFSHQLLLFFAHLLERLKQFMNLFEITLGLLAVMGHIGNEELKLCGPSGMAMLELIQKRFTVSLLLSQFSVEVLDLPIVLFGLDLAVGIIQFFELVLFHDYVLLLAV